MNPTIAGRAAEEPPCLVQPRPQWRLLDTGPADGFTNMAVDEALLEVLAAEGVPPPYASIAGPLQRCRWAMPNRSHPRSTSGSVSPRHRCGAAAHRGTGGLHDHEVTYSVVISGDDPRVTSGVLAAYLTISQALIRGLAYLGITAELLPLRRRVPLPSDKASPVCFATPSSYEVAVEGRKIIGSAQRRAHDVIMQHGSIPLSWNLKRMRTVFGPSRWQSGSRRGTDIPHCMTSLQEAGGRAYDYAEVVAALARGMAETWEVELIPGQLTDAERQLSAHLPRRNIARTPGPGIATLRGCYIKNDRLC